MLPTDFLQQHLLARRLGLAAPSWEAGAPVGFLETGLRFEADVVLDASGVSGQPTFLGEGGLPARGERALTHRLVRDLGTFGERLPSLPGRRILLVGHGHSAATAALALAELAAAEPSTRA